MKGAYPVFLIPIKEGYQVQVPDLPSCITWGSDVSDALLMAEDALSGCLLTLQDHQEEIPEPSDPQALSPAKGAILALISVDTEAYRRQTDTRAVRRSVSLPAWMAALAEQRGISFSKTLQDGLRQLL